MLKPLRRVLLVFGDQLNTDASVFDGADRDRDVIWMAEASSEATVVWSHRQRIVLFLAAMRHFRDRLRADGWTVDYTALDEVNHPGTLGGVLAAFLEERRPEEVRCTHPGEHRILRGVEQVCRRAGVPLTICEDRRYFCSLEEFRKHAAGRKELRMEYFYREMRRRYGILMENGKPVGGEWNYDEENRGSFGRKGPEDVPVPVIFPPDAVTREVMELVASRFPDHPGSLETFGWPVTREDALRALEGFVSGRLGGFGRWQDAMWPGEPWLWHSLLSSSLNIGLLVAAEVVAAAEKAWRDGRAPLAAVEGFIRQILGWREYVRGIYWMHMPGYEERNALGASEPLPGFYWTGETPYACLSDALGQTLRYGYAHHIQRLMVTGLYALLVGVNPRKLHEWYLAVYVDAVEWVEMPNTIGMSQYADGGLMASKPYIASGKYIQRMSGYCQRCPKNPALSIGAEACPFTTLYWDFMMRHEKVLRANPRAAMQVRQLERLDETTRAAIREAAEAVRRDPAGTVAAGSASP